MKSEVTARLWIYTTILFGLAVGVLTLVLLRNGTGLDTPGDWTAAAVFVVFGLFSISVGFPHPHFGHVSFDRVAQVATILVFGSVDAAWTSALASLLYPWHRLLRGEALSAVVVAALHNAGLMGLLVLVCGGLYEFVGGPVPLQRLNLASMGAVLLLVLSLQVLNEFAMNALSAVRGGAFLGRFSRFTNLVEFTSALDGILVAVVFNRLEWPVFALLVLLLSLGMGVLKSFAEIRFRLEELVDQRTRELEQKTVELDRQAREDPLTGLANRRCANERLEREIERARRYQRPVAVALADLDHFKQVNDRYSHGVGDQVLIRVAETLRTRCRGSDVVARYGGEEFLFCFPETSELEARDLCEDMRLGIESLDWSQTAQALQVTISFGVAELEAEETAGDLVDRADRRLYRAKRAGRNRVVAAQ